MHTDTRTAVQILMDDISNLRAANETLRKRVESSNALIVELTQQRDALMEVVAITEKFLRHHHSSRPGILKIADGLKEALAAAKEGY